MARKNPFLKLLIDLGNNERRRLIHFSVSATLFFVAYTMLYWVNNQMEASVEQEWAALSFVILAGAAFSWAITLQIVFIAAKVLNK